MVDKPDGVSRLANGLFEPMMFEFDAMCMEWGLSAILCNDSFGTLLMMISSLLLLKFL